MSVFRHAQIDTRYFAAPLEWFMTPHSFKQCNDLFIETATALGEAAARACLAQAGLEPRDVDHLIWVSTTGMAAPSPDAMLINRLGMGRHTRRTPIWGLGCAGGVAGLARAYEYTRAFPDQRVLLLSVELCSVTFQWNDHSKRNLIAASLFADGAAAVLVEGDAASGWGKGQAGQSQRRSSTRSPPCPPILGTQSTLWPDTLDIMGWDMVDTGMQVVFSSRIPHIVQTLMRENVAEFLAPLRPGDRRHRALDAAPRRRQGDRRLSGGAGDRPGAAGPHPRGVAQLRQYVVGNGVLRAGCVSAGRPAGAGRIWRAGGAGAGV